MRIKSLELKAFGPFTNKTLDFSSTLPGLHIIFGHNEAGKSSSLRALKTLLYGFQQQTPDNFLHNYDQLLVGGCLENSDGNNLVFQRRKKRIGDIIDGEGNTLEVSTLARFLHGVDSEIFESLYGIDHDTLVQGGEEILAQKGEVGQALFAAGAGLSSLKNVIDQLEKEATDLFKSAGQLPEINKALKKYKDLQQRQKTVGLSCNDWKNHQKTLKQAIQERTQLEEKRDQLNRELRRLERLDRAIPELASLKSWQQQLKLLGEITLLPPDFAKRHQQVIQRIREANLDLERNTDRLVQLEKQLQTISFNLKLVDQAARVDDFHQRLGEYRKGLKDRPVRDGMRISLRREAAQILKQLRPDLTLDELEPLRILLARKKTIQRLSAEYEAINRQLTLTKEQQKTSEQESEEVAQALAATQRLKDGQGLLLSVKIARKVGDIDTLLDEKRQEVDQEKTSCLTELKRIGLWSGELEALPELPLPLAETVQQFDRRYSDLQNDIDGQQKERDKAEQELRMALAELKRETHSGNMPTEELLVQAREKREHGWRLIRRQWLLKEDVAEECLVYDAIKPLPEAYEGYVQQSDSLADRLRLEADRVANAAALLARVENQRTTLAELEKKGTALNLQREEFESDWNKLWQPLGIKPLSPKEMGGWLTVIDRLRYKAEELQKKEQHITHTRQQQSSLRQAVQKELLALGAEHRIEGEKLGPILVFAETTLEKLREQQAERANLEARRETARKNVDQTREKLAHAGEALETWQQNWDKAVAELNPAGSPSTFEAIDQLELLQSCFDKIKEAEDLQKRMAGIDRDAKELENEVTILLNEVAPDLLSLPLDQAILQLQTLLKDNQRERALYTKLSEQVDSLKTEVLAAEKTLQNAERQLEELLLIARTDSPEKLTDSIRKFDEHQRISEKISTSKASLARIGAGIPVQELIQQAAAVDANELPGTIESLRHDIDQRINPEINTISQLIGKQNTLLANMDGNDKAAEIKERMEQELTRIRRLSEQYLRVKLASKLLQLEIERYREEHQDPVLKIASNYFSELTCGSFSGLHTDIDDKAEPILIGVRPEGRRVAVGGMSSGTRDQLYLALRLATLEWRLESQEPMPFIVDDILINFDDERSRATLEALAKLALRNQVILFTHHRRIVDEANDLSCKGTIIVHNLDQ